MKELGTKTTAPQVQESPLVAGKETLTRPDIVVTESTARKERGGWRLLREVVETILLTVVIFVIINTFTGRFRVEGPSMKPTLHEGQYLIINKIVYRLHPPRRGDVIVFHHPRNPSRDLIKRVVGLPGETVEINRGQVYIDGTLLEEPYVSSLGNYSVRYELGPDDFFVLGDNRPNSEDSRKWGSINRNQIVGKAWISYWPPESWGGVSDYSYPGNIAAQGQTSGVGDS